jgi:hypothetical protein
MSDKELEEYARQLEGKTPSQDLEKPLVIDDSDVELPSNSELQKALKNSSRRTE